MVEDMTRHPEAPLGAKVPGLRRPMSGTGAATYYGAAHYWHKRAKRAELTTILAIIAAVAEALRVLL
jgi:hypothetical protein